MTHALEPPKSFFFSFFSPSHPVVHPPLPQRHRPAPAASPEQDGPSGSSSWQRFAANFLSPSFRPTEQQRLQCHPAAPSCFAAQLLAEQ
ncbi:hypothetical protein BRADI_1g33220v3 [Brachypodium distachyon]|uniref:Uncharacterized protein n=1 Tax=Brachypodium distachyon TaxID=15368 RepID=A0A2K2DMI2_BRADI|nr:hypothetical protein BRADI_1g33220v3 [Brachypodium distachyon]